MNDVIGPDAPLDIATVQLSLLYGTASMAPTRGDAVVALRILDVAEPDRASGHPDQQERHQEWLLENKSSKMPGVHNTSSKVIAYDSFDAVKLQGRLHYYGRMQGKDDIGARERREDAFNSTAPCALRNVPVS